MSSSEKESLTPVANSLSSEFYLCKVLAGSVAEYTALPATRRFQELEPVVASVTNSLIVSSHALPGINFV